MAGSNTTTNTQHELSIAHLNINGLRNKVHDIYYILTSHQIHVLALSETHLDPSVEDTELHIRGYTLYRKDRDSCGGGVALYVQNQIPCQKRDDLKLYETEIIWVEIHLSGRPILVGSCYRPQRAKKRYLDRIMEKMNVSQQNKDIDIFLLGDFNQDLSASGSYDRSFDICPILKLTQVITEPTRVTLRKNGQLTSTCIDHIYTNVPEAQCRLTSIPTGCSDHNIVGVTVKREVPKAQEEIITKRSINKSNQETFIKEIQAVRWSNVRYEYDPELALDIFTKSFCEVADRHAQLEPCKDDAFAPWFEKVKPLMKERDDAKAQAHESHKHWDNFHELKRKTSRTNTTEKNKHFQQRIEGADNDPNKVHKILKEFLGRHVVCPVTTIKSEGRLITKADEVATYLNDYYINEIKELRSGLDGLEGLSASCFLIKKKIIKDKRCSFCFTEVGVDRVKRVLSKLEDLPAGLDKLDACILKAAAKHISAPVCHILNRSLVSGVFPLQWQEAMVIPVLKNHSENFSAKNSRAVTVLPVFSQVVEKMILEQIEQYFVENQLFTQDQRCLEKMMEHWNRELDNSRLVGLLFLDLSASLDLINHDVLLEKLKVYGFTDESLRLMKSYMSYRKQKVCCNNSFSEFESVDCGLPRGSCLRPLLFRIYTNDLMLVLKESTAVMCDHQMLVCYSAQHHSEINRVLGSELKSVCDWVCRNKMTLNVSNSVIISDREKLSNICQLISDVKNLNDINQIKLLSTTLHQAPSWSLYYDNIINKIQKVMTEKMCDDEGFQKVLKPVTEALVFSLLETPSVL